MGIRQKTILLLLFSSFMSVGWGQDCDEGYTEIDGECYYQSDLDVLQQFIDNSQGFWNSPPSNLSPINLDPILKFVFVVIMLFFYRRFDNYF